MVICCVDCHHAGVCRCSIVPYERLLHLLDEGQCVGVQLPICSVSLITVVWFPVWCSGGNLVCIQAVRAQVEVHHHLLSLWLFLVFIRSCIGKHLKSFKLSLIVMLQLVCLFPSPAAGWIALFSATVLSTVFLLRNLAPFVIVSAKKQAALLLGMVG